MGLSKDEMTAVFKEFGGSETNTGSAQAQVALFTERINHISAHLKEHKKDFSSERSLITMVGKRKRMLKYMAKKDINGYRALIEKLGLRK